MPGTASIKVADQVWIATALLHLESTESSGFSAAEIIDRVRSEFGKASPGVQVHIYLHAVASRPPSPGRYRILSSAGPGRWRLFKTGDHYHPEREGAKTQPLMAEIPHKYHHLLEWYKEYAKRPCPFTETHPLFRIVGIGDSGRSDISQEHDRYLADDYFEDSHDDAAKA